MRQSDLPNIFIIIVTFTPLLLGQMNRCGNVLDECLTEVGDHWTGCYEKRITTCVRRGRLSIPNFIKRMVNCSEEAEESPSLDHRVHIPAAALQMSRGNVSLSLDSEYVVLVVALLNSSLFGRGLQEGGSAGQSALVGEALGQGVLAVRAGNHAVTNLEQPVTLTFRHSNETAGGVCVFWDYSQGAGGGDRTHPLYKTIHCTYRSRHWSKEGCVTTHNDNEFVCSCNHLSFFAVLVNPGQVQQADALALSYISYIGSSLSVLFTAITLVMYLCRKGRLDQSVGVHIHLTCALLCLHLSFLVGLLWVWLGSEGRVCQALGLLLHYSLLATFSWNAIEGFHLYLLLVRVFNIYISKYLLKLSLVGWGLPIVVVVVYGSLGAYGKYSISTGTNTTSPTEICWLSSESGQLRQMSYLLVSVFLGLILLLNLAMLGVVLVKLAQQRVRGVMQQQWRVQMWKDWGTVLGLSCVLGLPWGLAFCTYGPLALPGLYVFTVLNSMQGVFMFLWFLGLTRKPRPLKGSSMNDPSTQKMETSFH